MAHFGYNFPAPVFKLPPFWQLGMRRLLAEDWLDRYSDLL